MQDQRERMVQTQIVERGIRDLAVIRAMRTVPREEFLPESARHLAYSDSALPIAELQTISQPYIVALMAQLLRLKPDHRVLEVGLGSGYAAAVLSRIVSEVYAIERHATLADHARDALARAGYANVHIRQGDGTLGWPEHAPFDAISVAAAPRAIPPALLDQLTIGGTLVIPRGAHAGEQHLIQVIRLTEKDYDEKDFGGVRFVPLVAGSPPAEST